MTCRRDIPVRMPGAKLARAAGLTLALALPGAAGAQEVTLNSLDGELNIRGMLVAFEDGKFRIKTVMGELTVPADVVRCIGEACPPDPGRGFPGETVELTDPSGETRLRGTLVRYTGLTYTIDTALGVLELPAEGVTCDGPGCPVLEAAVPAPTEAGAEAAEEAPVEPDAEPQVEADVAAVPAPAPATPAEPEPDARDIAAPESPDPSTPAESELIPIARLDGPADLRMAGPAPILEAIAPALADGFAARLGATASRADVEYVTATRAAEEGLPAGSMGLSLDGGPGGPVTLSGRFTQDTETTLDLLADGAADLVFATAPASLSDERLAGGLVLGSDGMVAVVAPDNPLTEISTDALARVFAGEITDWAALGGPEGPIRLIGLPESHAASVSLSELVLAPAGLAPRPADIVVPDIATLVSIVAGDPLAMGFVNNAAHDGARALDLVTSCGLRASPGPESFRSRRYPFTQAIVGRQGGESALAAELLDYLAGTPGLLREIGYADAAIGLQSLESDRQKLAGELADLPAGPLRSAAANALAGMQDTRRLNQVLYFERGTNRIDPQSRAALDRVLAWLEDNEVGEAFIVGHAPAGEDPGRALAAARAAAQLVLQDITLSETAPREVVFRRLALGGLLPVVCPGDIIHAASNSRVEIWVRAKG